MDRLALIALKWHSARALKTDAAWCGERTPIDARTLRRQVPRLRAIGSLIRDLHRPLARVFDDLVQDGLKHGKSLTQAREATILSLLLNTTMRLSPDMSEAEIASRGVAITDDELTIGYDADLFAPGTLERIDGEALVQAAVIGIRLTEWWVRSTGGRLSYGIGHRTELGLEVEAAREFAGYVQSSIGRPQYGHVAALMTVACPSRAFNNWRRASLRGLEKHARQGAPEGGRRTFPNDLTPAAHSFYLRQLGGRLSSLLHRSVPKGGR